MIAWSVRDRRPNTEPASSLLAQEFKLIGSRLCGLGSKGTQAIARKARTRPREHGGAYSLAERAQTLCGDLGITDPVRIAALDLLGKWRNMVVHSSERSIGLSSDNRKILLDARSHFYEKYAHLP